MQLERIRRSDLHNKVMSAEQASLFIKDGMTVGMSGLLVPVKRKLYHVRLQSECVKTQ